MAPLIPVVGRILAFAGIGILIDRVIFRSEMIKDVTKTLKEGSHQIIGDIKKDMRKSGA